MVVRWVDGGGNDGYGKLVVVEMVVLTERRYIIETYTYKMK